MNFEEQISKILGSKPDKILKLENLKSFSYVVDNSGDKYFFKFSKKTKVDKEKFGINYFRSMGIETPEIIYEGEDYLVTKFEENLKKINSMDLIQIVSSYQKKFIESSNLALIPSNFSREKINELYNRNKKHFIGFKTKGLSQILSKMNEQVYEKLPQIISHGDIHNKNIFLTKNNNPFILDFENMSSNYPTFDISTAIFYALNDAKGIINNYIKNPPQNFNILDSELIDLIIADTLRIAIYDTLYAKKRTKDKENLEKRIYNNKKFFDVFL